MWVIKDLGLGWLVVIKGMISVLFPYLNGLEEEERNGRRKRGSVMMGITSCLCLDLVLIGRIFKCVGSNVACHPMGKYT